MNVKEGIEGGMKDIIYRIGHESLAFNVVFVMRLCHQTNTVIAHSQD